MDTVSFDVAPKRGLGVWVRRTIHGAYDVDFYSLCRPTDCYKVRYRFFRQNQAESDPMVSLVPRNLRERQEHVVAVVVEAEASSERGALLQS